jgi:hypothetical protein
MLVGTYQIEDFLLRAVATNPESVKINPMEKRPLSKLKVKPCCTKPINRKTIPIARKLAGAFRFILSVIFSLPLCIWIASNALDVCLVLGLFVPVDR